MEQWLSIRPTISELETRWCGLHESCESCKIVRDVELVCSPGQRKRALFSVIAQSLPFYRVIHPNVQQDVNNHYLKYALQCAPPR